MKNINLFICCLLFALFAISNQKITAQCSAGEIKTSIAVNTDTYGYEGYWELVPSGSFCGTSTIFSGGNAFQVGCMGGGDQDATTAYGYGDNITITEGPFCLTEGNSYDIKYVDDWGDGGFKFTVLLTDGEFPMYNFTGTGPGNTFTFQASPPLDWDVSVNAITTYPYQNPGSIDIKASLFNYSGNTITNMNLNYSVNGGSVNSALVSGLNIPPYTAYDIIHPDAWNALANGSYSIKLWASELNGNADMNTANDTISKIIIVGDPIPDIIDQYLTFLPQFTVIGDAGDGVSSPRDLDFNPILSNYELWVINAGTSGTGGETVTFFNVGQAGQTHVVKQDGNAWHFMSLPTGIAFSQNTNFSTTTGILDDNHSGGHYSGPALWSSDMSIYAEPSGGNGSHIDMVHQEPFSMGIEADHDNAFWVNNTYNNCIDHVDFEKDHGPGNDDHSDARIERYTEIQVDRINDNTPSHLVLDKNAGWLYVADNGNHRVIRMNVNSGSVTGNFALYSESLAEHSIVTGVDWSDYITDGFETPCGIDFIGNKLLLGDYETGDIIIYDVSGPVATELGRIHTGETGLEGIKIGPDGKIWYVNNLQDQVVRVDVSDVLLTENIGFDNGVTIYPNPSNGMVHISLPDNITMGSRVTVYNLLGEKLSENNFSERDMEENIKDQPDGTYFLKIENGGRITTKQIILAKQ